MYERSKTIEISKYYGDEDDQGEDPETFIGRL